MPAPELGWDPEPLLAAAYRAAVTGSDAYRAVRAALRIERGVLRVGNRFVPASRYRDIAFVALGTASASLALAANEGLGERLSAGYVAGPVPLPSSVPFRSAPLAPGAPGSRAGRACANAVLELAGELGPEDLLVVLLSAGALAGLSEPPDGLDGPAWGALLSRAAQLRSTAAAIRIARVYGTGAAGGRLAAATRAHVETLIIDDGSGPETIGGGPTIPLAPTEEREAGEALAALGSSLGAPPLGSAAPRPNLARPVVVAGPADAIRSAGDALVERRWITRLGTLSTPLAPEPAAQLLLRRSDEELGALGGRVPSGGERGRSGSVGLAVFQGSTLGGFEGARPAGVARAFLAEARRRITRRDEVIVVLPTAGAPEGSPAGAFARWEKDGVAVDGALPMREGITDVGVVCILLMPARAEAPPLRGAVATSPGSPPAGRSGA
jgi:hypothetical protein